jgi:hypothetical protein
MKPILAGDRIEPLLSDAVFRAEADRARTAADFERLYQRAMTKVGNGWGIPLAEAEKIARDATRSADLGVSRTTPATEKPATAVNAPKLSIDELRRAVEALRETGYMARSVDPKEVDDGWGYRVGYDAASAYMRDQYPSPRELSAREKEPPRVISADWEMRDGKWTRTKGPTADSSGTPPDILAPDGFPLRCSDNPRSPYYCKRLVDSEAWAVFVDGVQRVGVVEFDRREGWATIEDPKTGRVQEVRGTIELRQVSPVSGLSRPVTTLRSYYADSRARDSYPMDPPGLDYATPRERAAKPTPRVPEVQIVRGPKGRRLPRHDEEL